MITFSTPGTPVPQGSKQAFTNGTKTWLVEANKDLKPWRERVAQSASIAMQLHQQKPLEGAVSLEIDFVMPRPKTVTRERHTVKPDLDKLVRAINDAITGICFKDDSQVVRINASKNYERFGTPGVIVTIHALNNETITTSAATAFYEQYLGK